MNKIRKSSLVKLNSLTLDKLINTSSNAGYPPELQVKKELNTKLFFIFLFVFQLAFTFQGLELADEGFLATFYQEIFKNPESVQYNFMFWLTGIIGGLYFKIFSFLGLWGLRLGGVIVITSTAMLVYSLLKKHLNNTYLKLGLFLVVTALNNDIKELNYNNLSAFINVLIIYFLFYGLKGNAWGKLFLSGLFVAMNDFIRLPNILGIGLVLAVVYYGYLNKYSLKQIAGNLFIFLSGILAGTVALFSIMYFVGHWDIFINSLKVVSNMSSAKKQYEFQGNDYGVMRLLKQFKTNNIRSVFVAVFVFTGSILGISVYSALEGKIPVLKKIAGLVRYILVLFILILMVLGVIDNYSFLFFYTGFILVVFALTLITNADTDIRLLLFCGCFIHSVEN